VVDDRATRMLDGLADVRHGDVAHGASPSLYAAPTR
jgi:hypothetical protein